MNPEKSPLQNTLATNKSGLGETGKSIAAKKAVADNTLGQLTANSRGVSLMQRVASPTVVEEKRGGARQQWQTAA